VNKDGTVGVSYFDFRTLPASDPATPLTGYWLTTSPRGGASFANEIPIIEQPFNLLDEPHRRGVAQHVRGDVLGG
jgi:hypothetical protein